MAYSRSHRSRRAGTFYYGLWGKYMYAYTNEDGGFVKFICSLKSRG